MTVDKPMNDPMMKIGWYPNNSVDVDGHPALPHVELATGVIHPKRVEQISRLPFDKNT